MKKLLIIRYGAFGDIIHCSHLPRIFKKEGWHVSFETNYKGYQLLYANPNIDNLLFFDPSSPENRGMTIANLQRRKAAMAEDYDRVIDLNGSIENAFIAMEDENVYFQDSETRRECFGNINYYDASIVAAGLPETYFGETGEVCYSKEEHDIAEKWIAKQRQKGKFLVMLNLSGTSLHKIFVNAKEVAESILAHYPDALIITTGDKTCKEADFPSERVVSIVDRFPFRQALLIVKHIDLIIGCESGIMVGASMWGTPSIQLLTAANKVNHCQYAQNDFSIQSNVPCSPCHKGPYKYLGCSKKDNLPVCVYGFPIETIMSKVKEAYECRASHSA